MAFRCLRLCLSTKVGFRGEARRSQRDRFVEPPDLSDFFFRGIQFVLAISTPTQRPVANLKNDHRGHIALRDRSSRLFSL